MPRSRGERWRPLAVVWLVTFAILLANGSARAEYLALAAPALFAAGAVWWEGRGRLARTAVAVLPFVLLAPIAPFALPCLSPARFVAWQRALGREPQSEERHRMGVLPQHWADMFGWPELADSVARVAATLPADERALAIVVVGNYGEAGALERFGAGRLPRHRLPAQQLVLLAARVGRRHGDPGRPRQRRGGGRVPLGRGRRPSRGIRSRCRTSRTCRS